MSESEPQPDSPPEHSPTEDGEGRERLHDLQDHVDSMRSERFAYLVRFAEGKEEKRSFSYVQDALKTVYFLDFHLEEPDPLFARMKRLRTLPMAEEAKEDFVRIFVLEILKYPPSLFRDMGGLRSVFAERLYRKAADGKKKESNLYGTYTRPGTGDETGGKIYVARDKDHKKGVPTPEVVKVEQELRDTIHHELLHAFFVMDEDFEGLQILSDYWKEHLYKSKKAFLLRLAKKLKILPKRRETGFFDDYSLTNQEEQVAVVMARMMSDAKGAYTLAKQDAFEHKNGDLFTQLNVIEGAFGVLSEGLMDDTYFRLLEHGALPVDYWFRRPDAW